MDKKELLQEIDAYKKRLRLEVLKAHSERGRDYGAERFTSWSNKISRFFDENLPGETGRLNQKLSSLVTSMRRAGEGDARYFWRTKGDKVCSYLDSLMLDIKRDEYQPPEIKKVGQSKEENKELDHSSVFIVHGHDNETKERTARFIEKLGYNAIILHEQASGEKQLLKKLKVTLMSGLPLFYIHRMTKVTINQMQKVASLIIGRDKT